MCSRFYIYETVYEEGNQENTGYGFPSKLSGIYRQGRSDQECFSLLRKGGESASISEGTAASKRRRDIHPGDIVEAAVYEPGAPQLTRRTMKWGFPREKKLTINARTETVMEKPFFREHFLFHRCVLPADGFYEWNAQKEKADFSIPDGSRFYLAGIYGLFDGEERFVVLTTDANDSMRSIHDRMPLILDRKEAARWVLSVSEAQGLLLKTPPILRKRMEYEQQNLQFLFEELQ